MRPVAVVAALALGLVGCGDEAPGRAVAPASSTSTSSSTTSSSTTEPVPPSTTTIPPDLIGLPETVDSAVGVWTRQPGLPDTGALPPNGPTGIPVPMEYATTYRIDDQVLAIGSVETYVETDEDLHLAVWRLTPSGAWQQTATGPPMPIHSYRGLGALSMVPFIREHDIVVMDGDGDIWSVGADGGIRPAGPTRPPVEPGSGHNDGFQTIVASGDAVLLANCGDGVCLWRDAWSAWRTFDLPGLPGGAEGTVTGVAQVRTVDGDLYVDTFGNGLMVGWKLTDPA